MANIKSIFLNQDADLEELDPAVDYLLAKGIVDGSGNSITIEDIEGNSHHHVTETIVLSLSQITSKAINLANTPESTSEVKMSVLGAGVQMLGQDYNLSGSSIVWTGLDIDGVISQNDIVKIEYSIK